MADFIFGNNLRYVFGHYVSKTGKYPEYYTTNAFGPMAAFDVSSDEATFIKTVLKNKLLNLSEAHVIKNLCESNGFKFNDKPTEKFSGMTNIHWEQYIKKSGQILTATSLGKVSYDTRLSKTQAEVATETVETEYLFGSKEADENARKAFRVNEEGGGEAAETPTIETEEVEAPEVETPEAKVIETEVEVPETEAEELKAEEGEEDSVTWEDLINNYNPIAPQMVRTPNITPTPQAPAQPQQTTDDEPREFNPYKEEAFDPFEVVTPHQKIRRYSQQFKDDLTTAIDQLKSIYEDCGEDLSIRRIDSIFGVISDSIDEMKCGNTDASSWLEESIAETIEVADGNATAIREKLKSPEFKIVKSSLQSLCGDYFNVRGSLDFMKSVKIAILPRVERGYKRLQFKAINKRLLILFGEPGTGKTTMAIELAKRNGNLVVINGKNEVTAMTISGNPGLTADELVRSFEFVDGKPIFTKSALRLAMEHGFTIVIDEANLLNLPTLRWMQAIFDNKDELTVFDTIKIHPKFNAIFTMNLSIGGDTLPLPKPLVDRAADVIKVKLTTEHIIKVLLGPMWVEKDEQGYLIESTAPVFDEDYIEI